MVDPVKITNFQRTQNELEEFLLFCIAVAGKNATRTAINLEKLLTYEQHVKNLSPFEMVNYLNNTHDLPSLMKSLGFGCFNIKAKGLVNAANSDLDLKTCSVDELERIFGIGMKTARYFVLHSRENVALACLDTHILNWLSYYTNLNVPKQTPTRKKYLELEQVFLEIATALRIPPAVLDLRIWNKQRGSDEESLGENSRTKKESIMDV